MTSIELRMHFHTHDPNVTEAFLALFLGFLIFRTGSTYNYAVY